MRELEWDWYVGDPCYVIEDERWYEFCEALNQKEQELKNLNIISNNPTITWTREIFSHSPQKTRISKTIDIYTDTGGDGSWSWKNSAQSMDGWVKGDTIYLDAGIVAIIPREILTPAKQEEAGQRNLGILFSGQEPPFLEVSEHLAGGMRLDTYDTDDITMCDCGQTLDKYYIYYCDNCGNSQCDDCYGNCGCFTCENCGKMCEEHRRADWYGDTITCTCRDCEGEE
tara:strand:- start:2118 stop:2798 length:681 start_codon:yes stop_codon:yes gene_type:complete